jgi:hypothetical protein
MTSTASRLAPHGSTANELRMLLARRETGCVLGRR